LAIRERFSLLLALLAIDLLNGCSNGHVSHVAYVTLAGADQIAAYKVDSSGKFSQIKNSPFSAGSSPSGMCVHTSKKFLYVANKNGGNVSLFGVDSSSGALTEASSRTSAGTNPVALAMDSAGKFLFAANSGSSNVSVYLINSSNGALTEVTGSPFPTGAKPIALTMSSSGFLYAAR
jgi:6-phosphogluconolactonase